MKSIAVCLLAVLLFAGAWALPSGAEQVCSEGIKASSPDTRFTVYDQGVVTADNTGLLWMRCSLGQAWDGQSCKGTAAVYTWAEALRIADEYEFAGYRDWRLPNKNELESIVEIRCSAPAVNSRIFPDTPATYFWTSSSYAGVAGGAWSIDFAYGTVNASVKSGKINVRLVRDQTWN